MSDPWAELLQELARVQADNRKLRRRNFVLARSRDYWKAEARAWQWGHRSLAEKLSPRSTVLSPTERAEASGVG